MTHQTYEAKKYSWRMLALSGQDISHSLPDLFHNLNQYCAWRFQFAIGKNENIEGDLEIRNEQNQILPVKNTNNINEDDPQYWITDRNLLTASLVLKFTFGEEGYCVCFFHVCCRPIKLSVPEAITYDMFNFYFSPESAIFEYRLKGLYDLIIHLRKKILQNHGKLQKKICCRSILRKMML